MAQRRMFSLKIIDTDIFLDMPPSAQALYFHLSLRADDDGFVAGPRKIMKICNSSDDDYKLLLAKQFLIPFETGICVITHWRIHNYIQSDRHHPTIYCAEMDKLKVLENGSYAALDTKCIQDVSRMDTEVRIDIGKDRIGEDKKEKSVLSCKHDHTRVLELSQKVIGRLNERMGTSYKHGTKATLKLIKARMDEGFDEHDFYKAIGYCVYKWKDNAEFKQFIRPQTIFSTKMESYLQAFQVEKNRAQHEQIKTEEAKRE